MVRPVAFPDFPGVSTYSDRKGNMRFRFRHPLIKEVTMRADFGTDAFAREYDDLMAQVRAKKAAAGMTGIDAPMPKKMEHIGQKTFRHAWILLQKSLAWDGLKGNTQRKIRDHIEAFLQVPVLEDAPDVLWADAPLAGVKADHLQAHYESIYRHHPPKAKLRVEAIRKLYDVAVKSKWIEREQNKTKFLDLQPLPESDANRPWTDEEKAMFEARYPLGTPQRTAYELAASLGSRRGDLATITPGHIKDRIEYAADGSVLRRFRAIEWQAIKGRKGKKPTVVYHEISDRLEKALAAVPHGMDPSKPILLRADKAGTPYNAADLSHRMAEWTRAAGLPKGLTLHGLRHTLGNELAEKGVESKQIQMALGHRSPVTTNHYTRRADREKLMKHVGKVQNGETEKTVTKTVPNLKIVS